MGASGKTGTSDRSGGAAEWERKRRRAEIFGESMPSVTADERDDPSVKKSRETASERWLKEQVPPHHG